MLPSGGWRMNYSIIALTMSLILLIIAISLQENSFEEFYIWPMEADKGILDTITTNTATYLSRTGTSNNVEIFLLRNLEIAEKYNYGFRVLKYSIVNATLYSSCEKAIVNMTVMYDMLWGRYCATVFLVIEVVNITEFRDPLTGDTYYKIIITCLMERGVPRSIIGIGSVEVSYSHNNIWILTCPKSLKTVMLEDWRGIRVELKIGGD